MRRSGTTTKLADMSVDDLFSNGYTKIRDHVDTRQMHEFLYKVVKRRLIIEHFKTEERFKMLVKEDKRELSLTLKKEV